MKRKESFLLLLIMRRRQVRHRPIIKHCDHFHSELRRLLSISSQLSTANGFIALCIFLSFFLLNQSFLRVPPTLASTVVSASTPLWGRTDSSVIALVLGPEESLVSQVMYG